MKKFVMRIVRLSLYIVTITSLIRSNSTETFTMWLLLLAILRNETNLDTLDDKINVLLVQQKANSIKLNNLFEKYKDK